MPCAFSCPFRPVIPDKSRQCNRQLDLDINLDRACRTLRSRLSSESALARWTDTCKMVTRLSSLLFLLTLRSCSLLYARWICETLRDASIRTFTLTRDGKRVQDSWSTSVCVSCVMYDPDTERPFFWVIIKSTSLLPALKLFYLNKSVTISNHFIVELTFWDRILFQYTWYFNGYPTSIYDSHASSTQKVDNCEKK